MHTGHVFVMVIWWVRSCNDYNVLAHHCHHHIFFWGWSHAIGLHDAFEICHTCIIFLFSGIPWRPAILCLGLVKNSETKVPQVLKEVQLLRGRCWTALRWQSLSCSWLVPPAFLGLKLQRLWLTFMHCPISMLTLRWHKSQICGGPYHPSILNSPTKSLCEHILIILYLCIYLLYFGTWSNGKSCIKILWVHEVFTPNMFANSCLQHTQGDISIHLESCFWRANIVWYSLALIFAGRQRQSFDAENSSRLDQNSSWKRLKFLRVYHCDTNGSHCTQSFDWM